MRPPGPPFIITAPYALSAEQSERLAATFAHEYGRGRVIVLPTGFEVRSPTMHEWLAWHTRGMTSRRWQREVPAVFVPLDELLPIQPEPLMPELVLPRADLAHVVEIDGRLYLEDGHHRFYRARRAGNPWLLARVFHAAG